MVVRPKRLLNGFGFFTGVSKVNLTFSGLSSHNPNCFWSHRDLNSGPLDYQSSALTNLSHGTMFRLDSIICSLILKKVSFWGGGDIFPSGLHTHFMGA